MNAETLAPHRPPRKRRGTGKLPPSPATLAGRVYVASSLPTFATDRYGRMVAHAAARFPRATILPARDSFRSNDDWRRSWPGVLDSLAAVAVFADAEGWIGFGVWTEVHDALRRGLPVYVLTDDGAACPWTAVAVAERDASDWQRYARLTVETARPETLDPNTPAWLAALADANPRQAAITAAVVDCAGRADMCSICGDAPAPVYRIEAGSAPLVRLCDECRAIQRNAFGLGSVAVGGAPSRDVPSRGTGAGDG